MNIEFILILMDLLYGGNRKLLLMTGAEFTLILAYILNLLFQKIFANFFQVPPNTPPNNIFNVFSGVPLVTPPDIIFNFIFNIFSVVFLVIIFGVFLIVFPDTTSSFNFRDSFPIGNNLVYNSVNHIFVVCNYYIIINYFF